MRGHSLIFAIVIVLAVMPAMSAEFLQSEEADRLIDVLMGRLEATPVKCPKKLISGDAAKIHYCGEAGPGFEGDAEAIQEVADKLFLHETLARLPADDPEWESSKRKAQRDYILPTRTVTVRVRKQDNLVLASYPLTCREFPTPPARKAGELLTAPKITRKAEPYYPEQARSVRRDGVVILNAAIGADGRTADICVVHVDPRNMGFEEAGLEAVRLWRYEPAEADGVPVAVLWQVRIDFTLH